MSAPIEAAMPAAGVPSPARSTDTTLPCTKAGWAVYDSTDAFDHLQARVGCMACPVRRGCLRLAEAIADEVGWAKAPSGTWGGVLWVKGRRVGPECPEGAA